MAGEVVIPILPCGDLKKTLEFYVALGFRVTHEQHVPYVYGAVEYENIQLHFYGRDLEPDTESSHIVLIHVPDADALHQVFSSGLRAAYGRPLRSGIPRLRGISSLPKERRFNLIDPSGNRLIVSQSTRAKEPKVKPKSVTPLARAVQAGKLAAYSRDAPEIAAEYLDEALKEIDMASEPDAVRFCVFVLRADIAGMLEDRKTLEKYVLLAKAVRLEEADQVGLGEEIRRLGELEEVLQS